VTGSLSASGARGSATTSASLAGVSRHHLQNPSRAGNDQVQNQILFIGISVLAE
jgi:hypothetical protein